METLQAILSALGMIPWRAIMLFACAAWLVVGLFSLHRKDTCGFEFEDLFLNDKCKADSYKLILIVMAVLSVYSVLYLLEHDKPVETLLLGVLAIFVGGRAASQYAPKEGGSQ